MFELIANAGHGDDIPGVCWVRLKLSPQTTNEDTQILSFLLVHGLPNPIQKMGANENLSRIKHFDESAH